MTPAKDITCQIATMGHEEEDMITEETSGDTGPEEAPPVPQETKESRANSHFSTVA